ncbi:MAG: Na+/H+ antiporter subunit E [Salinisphaeraceae bacterium]|nr:Na+/H+ antiporter subunit E [Salinisphaeraceae bacterium]
MLRILGLFFFLMLFWWLWSGYASPLLLGLGLGSCLLVLWIVLRMDVVDREAAPLHLTYRAPVYWLWLIVEILKSNLDTSRRILKPSQAQPTIAELPASQQSDLGKVIYANSITLTPGTLSMYLSDNQIEVHALHPLTIEQLRAGQMAKRVMEME